MINFDVTLTAQGLQSMIRNKYSNLIGQLEVHYFTYRPFHFEAPQSNFRLIGHFIEAFHTRVPDHNGMLIS